MNKIARMQIPMEKLDEVGALWPVWLGDELLKIGSGNDGNWTACVYEDTRSFHNNEKVLVIEGDSDVINPFVIQVMEILKS